MPIFEKGEQPLSEDEIAEHITAALEVEFSPGTGLDLGQVLMEKIFRPMVVGAENVPDKPCLFVCNHALFGLDALVLTPLMQKELGRFTRVLGDRFLFKVPDITDKLIQFGLVLGHPKVCSALMEKGCDILVFPGGAREAVKPSSDLYSLHWEDRYGFVKLAAAQGYTIMPFGLVGPDEFFGHYLEGHELPDTVLGRLLTFLGVLDENTRKDMLPPIPVGALGSLIPKPQRCYIGFANPIDLTELKGKRLTKKRMENIRAEVAAAIEQQLNALLLLRERHKGEDGLLRRILTL